MITLDMIPAVVMTKWNESLRDFLNGKDVKTVKDIERLLRNNCSENLEQAFIDLRNIKNCISKNNRDMKDVEIYPVTTYSIPELEYQDTINNESCLILENPIYDNGFKTEFSSIQNLSIRKIATDLSYVMPSGKNFLIEYYPLIGHKNVKCIANAINIFHEQIERQAALTTDYSINLFEMNQREKINIVWREYDEIIDYLLVDAELHFVLSNDPSKFGFVWGPLSCSAKKTYKSLSDCSTEKQLEKKKALISYIANYSTLPELEDISNHKMKSLDRFIVK